MTDDERASVAVLDGAAADEAAGLLRPSCASGRWVAELVAGRPYRSLDRLLAASDAAAAALGWPDIEQALAAHPRIGAPRIGRQAGRRPGPAAEQAGAAGAAADVQAGLAAGNAAYEARFGHVFLICAAGCSGAEMLAALRARLGNRRPASAGSPARAGRDRPAPAGQDVPVAAAAFRWLRRAGGEDGSVAISTHVLDATTGRPAAGLGLALSRRDDDGWRFLDHRETGPDGRVAGLAAGRHGRRLPDRVRHRPAKPAGRSSTRSGGVFRVADPAGHHHVPLLLSPFAYTTYRGS